MSVAGTNSMLERFGARGRGRAPRLVAILAALAATVFASSSAQATTIFDGDQTSVLVTSFFGLTDAGFDIVPLGDTLFGDDIVLDRNTGEPRQIAAFPITGGGINVVTGQVLIEHDGSGLALLKGDPTVEAKLENFQILLEDGLPGGSIGTLFGQVTIDDGVPAPNVPLFDITVCGLDASPACIDSDDSTILNGLRLGLTAAAASALNTVFPPEGDDPELFAPGDQIGVARVDARIIPEPGTLMLVCVGLFGLTFAGSPARRR